MLEIRKKKKNNDLEIINDFEKKNPIPDLSRDQSFFPDFQVRIYRGSTVLRRMMKFLRKKMRLFMKMTKRVKIMIII